MATPRQLEIQLPGRCRVMAKNGHNLGTVSTRRIKVGAKSTIYEKMTLWFWHD
jgi:hypothetical protein